MAQTVTVKSLDVNQQHTVAATGNVTYKHVLTFVDTAGTETTRSIWKGSDLYEKLAQNPIPAGHQVDVEQEKKGAYWNVVDIAKAGTLAQTAPPPPPPAKKAWSGGKGKTWTPAAANPDRDLSMDMGGLMHDAATIIAAKVTAGHSTESVDVGVLAETLVKQLYNAKQRAMAAVKDGTVKGSLTMVNVPEPMVKSIVADVWSQPTVLGSAPNTDKSFPF